jgi:hypothetical protein
MRVNRAACDDGRVGPIRTNELSGGEYDDEDNGNLLQSLAHRLPLSLSRDERHVENSSVYR